MALQISRNQSKINETYDVDIVEFVNPRKRISVLSEILDEEQNMLKTQNNSLFHKEYHHKILYEANLGYAILEDHPDTDRSLLTQGHIIIGYS